MSAGAGLVHTIECRRGDRRPVCKGCGREILWARSPTGAWLPLEVATAYTVRLGRHPEDAHAEVVARPTYVSHFITCPDRDRWSGRGRQARS